MKWITVLLAATAATSGAAAASMDDFLAIQSKLPQCSLACIASGAKTFGCNVTDLECQCNNFVAIKDETAPCMVKAGCNLTEITVVSTVVTDLCFNKLKLNSTPTPVTTGAKTLETSKNGAAGSLSTSSQSWMASAAILAGLFAML